MKHSNLGIAGTVLGIIGILTSCILIGIIPCIIGLVLSIVSACDINRKKTFPIIGIACSIIGIIIVCSFSILIAIAGKGAKSADNYSYSNESVVSEEKIQSEPDINNNNSDKEQKRKESLNRFIACVVLFSIIGGGLLILVIYEVVISSKKINQTTRRKICPRCGGTRFHAFVQEEIVVPERIKSSTSLNLNPLKPFTLYNHKEKVVRDRVTRNVSRFVCDDCGNIFK